MNLHIKQLAEQATIKTSYQYQTWGDRIATGHKEQFDKEKFAQLILLEVTDILSTYRGKVVFTDGAEYNYEHPIIAIRKHFGVKE
jgi:hypothetical protein